MNNTQPGVLAVLTWRRDAEAGVLTASANTADAARRLLLRTVIYDNISWSAEYAPLAPAYDERSSAVAWTPRAGVAAWASAGAGHDGRERLTASVRDVRRRLLAAESDLIDATLRSAAVPGATVVFSTHDLDVSLRVVDGRDTDPRALLMHSWLAVQRRDGRAIGLDDRALLPGTLDGVREVAPLRYADTLAGVHGRSGPGTVAVLTWDTPRGHGEVQAPHGQPALAFADLARAMVRDLPQVDPRELRPDADGRPTTAWASRHTAAMGRLSVADAGATTAALRAERDAVGAAFAAVRHELFGWAAHLLGGGINEIGLESGDVLFTLSLRPATPAPLPLIARWALRNGIVPVLDRPGHPLLSARRLRESGALATHVAEVRCETGECSVTLSASGPGAAAALRALGDMLVALPGAWTVACPTTGVVSTTAGAWEPALAGGLDRLRSATTVLSTAIANAERHDLAAGYRARIPHAGAAFELTVARKER